MQTALDQAVNDCLQLACRHLRGQSRRSQPCHIQHKGSLACFFGQENHAAHDPAGADHMGVFRQIGQRNQRSIFLSLGIPAQQIARINAEKDVLSCIGKRSKLDKDLAQPFRVNLSILKGFVQAGPFSR